MLLGHIRNLAAGPRGLGARPDQNQNPSTSGWQLSADLEETDQSADLTDPASPSPSLYPSLSLHFLFCSVIPLFWSAKSNWRFKGRPSRVVFLATRHTVTAVAVVYCFCELLLFYCFHLIGP